VEKRSITISGHRTSISIEDPFWQALSEIAKSRRMSIAAMIAEIDRKRAAKGGLSSAIRLYVLAWYKSAPRP
jgi:predicted DNA-binding ribbon-helix-helix protein